MPSVRFARISQGGQTSFARIEGDEAHLLTRPPWYGETPTGTVVPLTTARYECPVLPSKIFGIGRNYAAHAKELGNAVPEYPLVFPKNTTSLTGPGTLVLLPPESEHVAYEGELGVVIGSRCRRVPKERALEHVFGCTALCDVTARDLQTKDGQWVRAKGFDTFCPVGPVIVTGLDPDALDVTLTQNGVVRQQANTRSMIFSVAELVSFVSSFATLLPGDLILTGTPDGVGPLAAGDRVEVTVENVGTLAFGVEKEG